MEGQSGAKDLEPSRFLLQRITTTSLSCLFTCILKNIGSACLFILRGKLGFSQSMSTDWGCLRTGFWVEYWDL